MHRLTTSLFLALPLTALAGLPHQGSLRRRHYNHLQDVAYLNRRDVTYEQVDEYNATNFIDKFDFFTASDPTHGLVDFVSQSEAQSAGLAYVQSDNTIVLAVDSTTQLALNEPRKSIHINSKTTYDSGSLIITSMFSMPHGCATWPAYWTVGNDWPNQGEIDIIEGVNTQTTNRITAHTGDSCTVDKSVQTLGNLETTDCQSTQDSNAGCSYSTPNNATYGHGFNVNGGGVYAHTWDDSGINVYFWDRPSIPEDILSGDPQVGTWGPPLAAFTSGDCDISSSFKNHQIVFDITLCGDWAGGNYPASGCPGTCAQAVMDPSNFKAAQFKIEYIKVFKRTN